MCMVRESVGGGGVDSGVGFRADGDSMAGVAVCVECGGNFTRVCSGCVEEVAMDEKIISNPFLPPVLPSEWATGDMNLLVFRNFFVSVGRVLRDTRFGKHNESFENWFARMDRKARSRMRYEKRIKRR